MACNPQGDVCHYKNYMCDISSARADCCGGLGAKGGVCQLDLLGVPRCNGLGDTCITSGDICASADDCCDNHPCVPDAQGVLRCYSTPPGGPNCVPSTGPCTINGDCCPGTSCMRSIGSTMGSCVPTPPPPGGGGGTGGGTGGTGSGGTGSGGTGSGGTGSGGTGSGGTGSGGTGSGGTGSGGTGGSGPPNTCSQYGQTCNVDSDCCNGVPCTQGICRVQIG